MGGGPPAFKPGYTCPVLLRILPAALWISPTGVSPSAPDLSRVLRLSMPHAYGSPYPGRLGLPVWALPRSLAATRGIDVSFSSWGYLDVSVHPVPFSQAIDSPVDTCALPQVRSRIRRSVDITDMCSSPQLIAACHVLLRLPVPRHPPYALCHLTFCRSSDKAVFW